MTNKERMLEKHILTTVAGMGYPDIADYDHTAARNNVSAYTS
jgi:hypothetical protein